MIILHFLDCIFKIEHSIFFVFKIIERQENPPYKLSNPTDNHH